MKAIDPALTAQMKVPITICCLRPQASAKAPNSTAPTISPTPPL
jgi:hypothetical protein